MTAARTSLCSLLLLLALVGLARAEQSSPGDTTTELPAMSVVATKSPRPVDEVAGTVSVIDSQRLRAELAHSVDDMVRYQTGVSAVGAGTRFGGQGFNIRGVGGNRVAIELDGIPLADQFDIGRHANSGRDVVDIDLLNRVEILRGPASTLYGSKAIGGVVAYFTHRPGDLVQASGRPHYSLRSAYHGVDNALSNNFTVAGVADTLGGLLSLTHRQGHEVDSPLGGRDRKDYSSTSAFARISWDQSDADRLMLTVDSFQRDDFTDIRSVLGSGRFRSTTLLTGDDEQQRDRLSLDYGFSTDRPWLEQGQLLAYSQRTDTGQFTIEERAGNGIRRDRQFDYRQSVSGFEANFSNTLVLGQSHHRLGFGLEFARTDTREQRDALQIDLLSGMTTNVVLGEQFPVRDFPLTETRELGLYLQDEITWSDAGLTLIPALRLDDYDLNVTADALYLEDNPDSPLVEISEQDISPKLGFVYQAGDRLSWFGQYARGFRAPPFEDVNIGLDIPLFNIRAIPNPDLRSETSDGLELGLRYQGPYTSLAVSFFHTDYRNFIETRVNLGPDPDTGVLLFQSRNISRARIRGVELDLSHQFGRWMPGLADLRMNLGLSWTRGRNEDNGLPLNDVQPAEALLGFSWAPPDGRLSASANATFVAGRDRVDESAGDLFQPSGYALFDLSASYRPKSWMTLRAGLFNVTDKTYWRWSDIQGLRVGDPLVNALAAAGRNAALSLSLNW